MEAAAVYAPLGDGCSALSSLFSLERDYQANPEGTVSRAVFAPSTVR
jgi:hypothetical protein